MLFTVLTAFPLIHEVLFQVLLELPSIKFLIFVLLMFWSAGFPFIVFKVLCRLRYRLQVAIVGDMLQIEERKIFRRRYELPVEDVRLRIASCGGRNKQGEVALGISTVDNEHEFFIGGLLKSEAFDELCEFLDIDFS